MNCRARGDSSGGRGVRGEMGGGGRVEGGYGDG